MFKALLLLLFLQIPGVDPLGPRRQSVAQHSFSDSVPEIGAWGSRRSYYRSSFLGTRSRGPTSLGGLAAELIFIVILAVFFRLLGFGKGNDSSRFR